MMGAQDQNAPPVVSDTGRAQAQTAAGLDDEFGKTDASRFSTGFTDVFRAGEIYPWGTTGGAYDIEKNGDGNDNNTEDKI